MLLHMLCVSVRFSLPRVFFLSSVKLKRVFNANLPGSLARSAGAFQGERLRSLYQCPNWTNRINEAN